ncbi:MAG: hypothetical protein QOE55_8647, partial [Acidobacteriaceae bacterium]|nr:hypothetical protein [Acidobacteriaceae bacterium]
KVPNATWPFRLSPLIDGFSDSGLPQKWAPHLVHQFFGVEFRCCLAASRPRSHTRRAMGHRLEKRLPAGGILDLFQLLRKIEIIPANDAVLDEPLAGYRHLLVFFFRL